MKRRVRRTFIPKLIDVEEYPMIMHVVDYWQSNGEYYANKEMPNDD